MNVWPIGRSERSYPSWQFWRRPWARAFWNRAYKENITGLAGMIAYNLMLAVFPFALLVLFIFGQVVDRPDIEHSVVLDIRRLFPNIEQGTLMEAIDRVRSSSTTIGIAAIVGGIWIGASFWGAMDTAFCRIYHVECRGWVQQKRWSLVMLLGLLLLLVASVSVPTIESAALSKADDLVGGDDVFFAATGVTDGDLLAGVRYLDDGHATTESLVMRSRSGTIRRVQATHDRPKLREVVGTRYG